MKKNNWLIFYDICNPKRLRVIEKIVSQYGVRLQKSVFEVNANNDIICTIKKRLGLVVKDEDSVVIIPLCEKDWHKLEKHGKMF